MALALLLLPSLVESALIISVRSRQYSPPLPVTSRARRIVSCREDEPIWISNTVAMISDASVGLKALTIVPPAGVANGFTAPGQYVQIRQPGAEKAGFFAIASSPAEAHGAPPEMIHPFEFLIKETPPSDWSPGTGWLMGAAAGASLEMSKVEYLELHRFVPLALHLSLSR